MKLTSMHFIVGLLALVGVLMAMRGYTETKVAINEYAKLEKLRQAVPIQDATVYEVLR